MLDYVLFVFSLIRAKIMKNVESGCCLCTNHRSLTLAWYECVFMPALEKWVSQSKKQCALNPSVSEHYAMICLSLSYANVGRDLPPS